MRPLGLWSLLVAKRGYLEISSRSVPDLDVATFRCFIFARLLLRPRSVRTNTGRSPGTTPVLEEPLALSATELLLGLVVASGCIEVDPIPGVNGLVSLLSCTGVPRKLVLELTQSQGSGLGVLMVLRVLVEGMGGELQASDCIPSPPTLRTQLRLMPQVVVRPSSS